MSHSDTANRGVDPDPSALPTLKWGVVGILITVLVILICQVFYYHTMRDLGAEKVHTASRPSEADRLKVRQLDQLEQARWSEGGQPTLLAIPSEVAIERLVSERRRSR